MIPRNNKKPRRDSRNNRQRRECYFTANNIKDVDYKDLEMLARFTNEAGKITPARVTGIKARYQRKVTKAIKIARYLALIPYCDAHRQQF